jgi:WD40 repeat protein
MGIVYRARQTQINRLVALKVLASGHFASPDFLKRFRTEAEAVASLDHPNIVPIHEVGECEGQPFFSMKFVAGGSLAGRISNLKSPLPDQAAAELLVKLARAVHYAHQRGILHRDIKPGNVLLDAQGEPHLTDFGLAKLVEKDSTLTRTMAMLGTPSYMSPEQARGEAKQLTTAVDVYGLGAVLYQVLTGHPPFAGGTTMETVRQVLDTEPRRPSTLKPGTDRDLETICLKCLEKDPSRRYGSAIELAEDLERWQRQEPILARPVGRLERLAKLVRRHPVASAFAAISLLAVTASVVILVRANVQIRSAQGNEMTLRQQAEGVAEERRQGLVRLNVSTGNRLAQDGDSYTALLWFTEALRLENGDVAREDIHRRRFAAVLRHAPELTHIWFHDRFLYSAEFSPSGDRVISITARDVQVWDVATGKPAIPSWTPSKDVQGAKFTRDEKRLVTVANGQVQCWDAATGEPLGAPKPTTAYEAYGLDSSADGQWLAVPTQNGVQLYGRNDELGPLLAESRNANFVRFNPYGPYLVVRKNPDLHFWKFDSGVWVMKSVTHPAAVHGLDFSRDGQTLAAGAAGSVFLWDLANAQPAQPPIQINSAVFDCRFSPDDRWLATASWDGVARVFDARNATLVSDHLRHGAGVRSSIFSPDGQRLATASFDNTARIWNPQTGEPVSPWLPHAGYVVWINFSPDGTRLVTASQDQTVHLWTLRTNSGTRLGLRHEQTILAVQFSPDGQRLLTCGYDGFAKVWDVRTGRLVLSLRHAAPVQCGSFSPDGQRIVTACSDGGARLWDAEGGTEVVPAMRHKKGLEYAAFSGDGQRLVTACNDGTARVWNLVDGQQITLPMQHRGPVVRAAFSPNGRTVLTVSGNTAQLWDAQSGEPVGKTMSHPAVVRQANFSPDGRRLVTACADPSVVPMAAQMWDAATGETIGPPLQHRDGVLSAQFSPDGRFIATGGEDRIAVIWDADTGARLTPSMPHGSHVVHCAFSPDSRLLLTLTGMGLDTARVWECATGEPVTPPFKHASGPLQGTWSPDGRAVAVGDGKGTVSVWDLSPQSGPVQELQRQAEVLSSHQIEPNLGLVPLSAREMKERWEIMKAGAAR